MSYSGDTIQKMALEVYGIQIIKNRAADVAEQATELIEAARRGGIEADFNEELLSCRLALLGGKDVSSSK